MSGAATPALLLLLLPLVMLVLALFVIVWPLLALASTLMSVLLMTSALEGPLVRAWDRPLSKPRSRLIRSVSMMARARVGNAGEAHATAPNWLSCTITDTVTCAG